MEYLVLNRQAAKRYSCKPQDKSSIMISIYSSDETPNKIARITENLIQAVLHICFDDVGRNEPCCMSAQDAARIRSFLEQHWEHTERLIVHCDAGISRSAGVCAAIMKFYEGTDLPIFDCKQYRPNMHCYRVMLEELFENTQKEGI